MKLSSEKNIRTNLNKIFELCKKSDIFRSIFFGTLSFFIIFSLDFAQGRTDFFYQADSLVELAAYHSFMNTELRFPLFNTDKIFPGEDFSLIWLSSSQVYFFFLKILKSIFNIYFFNPFPLYYFLNFLIFSFVIQKLLNELNIYSLFQISIFQFMILLNPVFINRIVYHLNLISHWIIILVIYLSIKISREDYLSINKLAFVAGSSIYFHPYISFISSTVFIFYFGFVLLKQKIQYLMRSLLIFIVSISSYFFFILRPDNLIGGSDSYRGAWSAEFNSFFCARNPNPFINEKLWCYRPYINYDHEGYLYLGLGIIVGLSALLFNFKSFRQIFNSYYPLITSSVLLLLISFGNKWKIAHKQIFEFVPNTLFNTILESFRSNGRFGWLFYYCIFISVLISINKVKRKFIKYSFFLIVFSFQVADLQKNYLDYEMKIFNAKEKPTEFINTSLELVENNNLLYIYPDDRCFHYENYYYENDPYLFAIIHLSNGGSINTSRLGRYSGKYADRQFCEVYNINKEIIEDRPFHFVILKDFYEPISDNFSNYSCDEISSYMESNKYLLYCTLNN